MEGIGRYQGCCDGVYRWVVVADFSMIVFCLHVVPLHQLI